MHDSLIFDESALLQQLQAGSAMAFTRLYHKYSVQMYSNILKMIKDEQIAEEITQEVFACIWQKKGGNSVRKEFCGLPV